MKTLIVLVSLLAVGTVSASTSTKNKKAAVKPTTSFLSKKNMSKTDAAKVNSTDKTAATPAQPQQQPSKSGLSTDVRFGDQAVGGKYQLPMEALSVVENEKSIDDLIGVRKNFQDRVARTKGMR